MEIDLELDGVAELQSTIGDLERRGESDAVYVTGSNVEYGVTLEFGRGGFSVPSDTAIPIETESGETIFRQSVEGHPPYPWFRPAIREFKANPEQFLLKNTDFSSIDAIETTDELVAAVAVALENQMTANVNAQDPSTNRSPGTHPDHPSRDTGNLSASIQAVRVR